MLIPRNTTSCPVGFTYRRTTVGAMGNEVRRNKIALGDQMQIVTSPVGKRVAKDFCCLAHAFRPIGGARQRRVVIDEPWIEVAINGRQLTIREQGGYEVLDDLLVSGPAHVAMVGCQRSIHHPTNVGCFSARLGRRMASWTQAARLRGARRIWCVAVTPDSAAQRFKPR
jgi:hypothetical protein